jgi:cyclohexyl-isocyanide hydratase
LADQAGVERASAQCGAVTLMQRFGSALNLNIHLHMLWLDGVYEQAIAPPPRAARPAAGNGCKVAADSAPVQHRREQSPLADPRSAPNGAVARPPDTRQTARKGRLNFLYPMNRRRWIQMLGAAGLAGCQRSTLTPEPATSDGAGVGDAAVDADERPLDLGIPAGPPQQIAMLAYPRMTLIDLVGPQLFFAAMGNTTVHVVAATREPIVTDTGMTIVPSTDFAGCPAELTILFVPGGTAGTVAAMRDTATLEFLRARAGSTAWLASVCTGALVLGAAGLLQGYRATTHWVARDLLGEAGAIAVDERVVVDRNRVTAAGVSAGIDLGLWFGYHLRSADLARALALNAEYAPQPVVDAGTPGRAGPRVTAYLQELYAPFRASVSDVLPG